MACATGLAEGREPRHDLPLLRGGVVSEQKERQETDTRGDREESKVSLIVGAEHRPLRHNAMFMINDALQPCKQKF